ncbi:hypothetical protein ACFWZU_07845 [Frateuria sp. GZRR33]|uniref:5-methylcytosine restriction system specificity protein McrC n=1 Tax=Frateuria sp. GZRR33 TaxID=3351535 RepID=UPI003EDC6127
MDGLKVVDLREREARIFAREDLISPGGQSLILPETRALSAMDLLDVAGGIEVKVKGLIGYLPVTTSLAFNVQPKFPLPNLWKMLEGGGESYGRVLAVLRSYESASTNAPHLLLARAFCHYLKTLLRLGLSRGYFQDSHDGYFKPKVNIGRTVARFLSRGDDVNVSSDVFNYSVDIKANRAMKAACIHVLRLLPHSDDWKQERVLLADALNAFHPVAAQPLRADDQDLARSLPIWVRDGYIGALAVYSMLLGYTKIGFGYGSRANELPSFLFSLDGIFENYVRNAFRLALASAGIAVLDGNKNHNHKLFEDNKDFSIKPDLMFRREGNFLGIGEVKYKPKVSEEDRYQVISHVVATKAPVGIWISPGDAENAGVQRVGKIATGACFYHYRLDVSGDIEDAAARMVATVRELFP